MNWSASNFTDGSIACEESMLRDLVHFITKYYDENSSCTKTYLRVGYHPIEGRILRFMWIEGKGGLLNVIFEDSRVLAVKLTCHYEERYHCSFANIVMYDKKLTLDFFAGIKYYF